MSGHLPECFETWQIPRHSIVGRFISAESYIFENVGR